MADPKGFLKSGRQVAGRRPVEGGYEEDGAKLYHAIAVVHGVRVPGKAGPHLVGDMRRPSSMHLSDAEYHSVALVCRSAVRNTPSNTARSCEFTMHTACGGTFC